MVWRVFRYEIPISSIDSVTGVVSLRVPRYATPLSVLTKNGNIQVYFKVNPDAKLEKRELYVIGTGQCITQDMGNIIGSVLLPWGEDLSAYHVFDWNK